MLGILDTTISDGGDAIEDEIGNIVIFQPSLQRSATMIKTTEVVINGNKLFIPVYNIPDGLTKCALWLQQIINGQPLTDAVIKNGIVMLAESVILGLASHHEVTDSV